MSTPPIVSVIPESMASAAQVYADGLSAMIGIPVSKIQIQTTVGLDEKSGKELRKINFQVTVPTSTLIEFCQNTLKGLAENEKPISMALEEFNAKINSTYAADK